MHNRTHFTNYAEIFALGVFEHWVVVTVVGDDFYAVAGALEAFYEAVAFVDYGVDAVGAVVAVQVADDYVAVEEGWFHGVAFYTGGSEL